MTEKKYYWLKLKGEFFEDKAIKKLRKLAGGDTYTIIYLKMMLKAITQENKLYFEGVEETFPEELALELDEDEENVSVTLSYLQSKGLLKVLSEEELYLMQCEEMVGSETDAARRKRLQRAREEARMALEGNEAKAIPQKAPQKRETQMQIFDRLLPDYGLSATTVAALEQWLQYKTERKEPYKEQGMKMLLKQVKSREQAYGAAAVAALIEQCMSCNWKGIIWEKLEKQKPNQNRLNVVDDWQ